MNLKTGPALLHVISLEAHNYALPSPFSFDFDRIPTRVALRLSTATVDKVTRSGIYLQGIMSNQHLMDRDPHHVYPRNFVSH